MEKVLFLSLGNRDLQLPRNASIPIDIFNKHFELGSMDTGENYVLKKTDKQFLVHSEAIYELYEELAGLVCFPMVDATLEEVGRDLAQIVIITTQQEPADSQDCQYVALFLKKWLEQNGFSVVYKPITFPPIHLDQLMDFYNELYDQYARYQIFFGNSGGTPDMRAATHMAGMFRNIRFVTLQARTQEASQKNFRSQEKRILQHIVDNMLKVYDYEGVKNLPVSDRVKEKCDEALDLYNLKTNIVRGDEGFGEKSKKAIALLLENMKICFHQGRYADVIGRIFRIEEAVGQYLLYTELKQREGISDQDKVYRIDSKGKKKADKSFEQTIANGESSEAMYLYYFQEEFTFIISPKEEKVWYFVKHPDVPMKAGKNTFFFLFSALKKHQDLYQIFMRLNDNYAKVNKLTTLRNKSYLGHGFNGVSESDIEEITGNFLEFYNELKALLEKVLNIVIEPIFDDLNEQIKNL